MAKKKKNKEIDKYKNLKNELSQVILKREISSHDKPFVDDIRELDEMIDCWFRSVVYRKHDLKEIIEGLKK